MPLLPLGPLSLHPPEAPLCSGVLPLSQTTPLLQGTLPPLSRKRFQASLFRRQGLETPQALYGQIRYLLAAFLPKASISCLRHSIPSICSWAESSGPRGGMVATRADSDDLLWCMTGGAEPCGWECLSPCGPLASSPAPDSCGENGVCIKG